jgi:hypothetical protein
MQNDKSYGNDRFTYRRGESRRRIGRAEDIRPQPHESNEDFQRRMERMVECLLELHPEIESVDLQFERRAGVLVECTIDAIYAPTPEVIQPDTRSTARRAEPRGSRGGQKHTGRLALGLSGA